MTGGSVATFAIFWLGIAQVSMAGVPGSSNPAEMAQKGEDLEVTPSVVREIQFMLLRLGMEPGPIDGVAGPQTAKALRKFQQDAGLPVAELVNGGRVSGSLMARLRSEASRVIFENERRPEAPPTTATAPAPAVTPPERPVESPDRFADCSFSPEDFRVGGKQYTPDKYLQDGFDGSTSRAVSMLKDRLNEARQIAGNIGGAALTEVQRQARVLNYYDCRLKIEQASGK